MISRFPRAIKNKNVTNVTRRKHINFKIEIKKKIDIETFIQFLEFDIIKRLEIDKKYYNDTNECHLKHLNFILMEMILCKTLEIYRDYYEILDNKENNNKDIKNEILYIPLEEYKKDLTIINRKMINDRYEFIDDDAKLNKIAKEIYDKYKDFRFVNLNFLKRKIYEYI